MPLAAIACGTPVVAYGHGGALETVRDGVTGVFFAEQTVEALTDAVRRVDALHIDDAVAQRETAPFTKAAFQQRLVASLERCVPGFIAPAVVHVDALA